MQRDVVRPRSGAVSMTHAGNEPRLLHVLQSLDPASGGVAAACSRLAAGQGQAGHGVLVYARRGRHGPASEAMSCMGTLAEAVAEADCVHLHGVWDAILFRAALAARRAGVPYVITPHGMLDPWSLAQKGLKKRIALALGYRRMLDQAAALVALHGDEAASFRSLGLRAPVAVVPNGVSLAEVDASPSEEFRRGVPGLGDAPFVLFLGRLHHKKGLDYLADAFAHGSARAPWAHLVVAGPDEGARGDFERRVSGLGLAGRVHLVGPLFGRSKWAAYSGAACFCLPSRQEGFSVAVLEALASRLPVVLSPACHFPEVEPAGAGLVVPLDPVSIGEALARIVGDQALRERMGRAGRLLVEDRYTWGRVVGLMAEVYARATGGGAR